MKVLLFAGAGTSVELGVPAMVGMGEEFLEHVRQWNVEPELVQTLIGDSFDVEHLIEALDRICSARSSLRAIGENPISLDRVDKIRAEVEWFVQHAAERVLAKDARLMWGSVLRAAASIDLTLITTNYDRAIELAANSEGVAVDDGFAPFAQGETASWVGFATTRIRPRLVKLHGSTDWYAAGEFRSPTKLRHPMPLFGRAKLRLTDGSELGSALVLPSREKLLTNDPYPRLSQTFLNAADECGLAVFVGSSLRDLHIRGAVTEIARRVPLFVVNPDGDSYEMQGATVIRQCASSFLIGTLPNALMSRHPVAALQAVASSRKGLDAKGSLVATSQALDSDLPVNVRCRALEDLDAMGLSLDLVLLRRLLADQSSTVARYTLGLIPLSSERERLIQEAAESPHVADPAFIEDLQLLSSLVSTNQVATTS